MEFINEIRIIINCLSLVRHVVEGFRNAIFEFGVYNDKVVTET